MTLSGWWCQSVDLFYSKEAEIIVHLHEIFDWHGKTWNLNAMILLWHLFKTIVNDAFMSVLSTTAALFWLYYLQPFWPHSNWLCANSLASACSRFTLNTVDALSHISLNKSTFGGFREMGHKHELKWKKKKKKPSSPGGKQFINKLCNDNGGNASQIKVKSWIWSFSKAAHYQYIQYIIMLH